MNCIPYNGSRGNWGTTQMSHTGMRESDHETLASVEKEESPGLPASLNRVRVKCRPLLLVMRCITLIGRGPLP